MSKPLVSVVIPAYNHEKFIGAAIESVLNQSLDDFELVIVDDGSTDNTAEVIKGYEDSRISYTWQKNQDAFNTINRGMGIACGQYISILNSDDIYTLDRLEKLVDYAKKEKVDCLFSDVIPISDTGQALTAPEFGWNQWHQNNRDVYFKYGDLYTGFLHGNFMVTTSNLFMSRNVVETVGNFTDLRYLHDYDYVFRIMSAFPETVAYLDNQKLLYYRIHPGNTLSEAAITGREQDLDIIKKYMLEKVSQSHRQYAEVGSDRLRQLEREIHEVRQQLTQNSSKNIRISQLKGIAKKLIRMVSAK